MGEVFLGRDPVLGREVAIKTILASSAFGEEAKARFEREAKATALLNHPHIVTIYEFGEEEGIHFLAMEYLEGEDLEILIRKHALSKAECLEVLAQACEGLACAHEHGVVHRDVKPANILITRRGKKFMAKLMDFGVALISQSNLTQQGVWMGTANYMAPEYLDTGKATPSSDIFAVGVILYEVLTGGRKPFSGETTTMVLNAILRHPPQPFLPGEIQDVDPRLLEVVKKALAKTPEDRFDSAEHLANAIREASVLRAKVVTEHGTEVIHRVPERAPKPQVEKHLVVGKGGKANCLSLRVALRQATPGAQIILLPGTYRESLVVDKDVLVQGEGDPTQIVIESTLGPCLTQKSGNVQLQGLTLHKSPNGTGDSSPAVLVQSGRSTLQDCELVSTQGTALVIEGSGTQAVLTRCRFQGGSPIGLEAGPGTSATLDDCSARGHVRAAVVVGSSASVTLTRTTLRDAEGVGVSIQPGGQATLEDCEIEDCKAGSVEVEAEGRAQLRRCRLVASRFAGLLAFEKGQATLEECEIHQHGASGVHAIEGATILLRNCHLHHNQGFGVSVMDRGLGTLDGCEINDNHHPGVLVHGEGTIQLKHCKLHDGKSLGVVCSAKGRGVLEDCEVYGNAQSGAKVERGSSLLLVRCVLRDGQDTGLLLFEDAELTLEECVVHRNARGGILLSKDASDPILRGGNTIEDDLLRTNPQGGLVKLAPVKRR